MDGRCFLSSHGRGACLEAGAAETSGGCESLSPWVLSSRPRQCWARALRGARQRQRGERRSQRTERRGHVIAAGWGMWCPGLCSFPVCNCLVLASPRARRKASLNSRIGRAAALAKAQ
ncbi:unnamed protein product [Lepidochelys kempii]